MRLPGIIYIPFGIVLAALFSQVAIAQNGNLRATTIGQHREGGPIYNGRLEFQTGEIPREERSGMMASHYKFNYYDQTAYARMGIDQTAYIHMAEEFAKMTKESKMALPPSYPLDKATSNIPAKNLGPTVGGGVGTGVPTTPTYDGVPSSGGR